jgi:hypothetical protein
MEQMRNSLSGFGFILGLSLIVSTLIGVGVFYKIKSGENVLSVTGSAKKAVLSDQVKWSLSVSRIAKVTTLKSGYEQIARDTDIVKKFLKDNGVVDTEITISPVYMDQNYDQQYVSQEDKSYTLRQTIDIDSVDVVKIEALAKNTGSVINQGVVMSVNSLQFYYSKLADERIALLADAVKDAKARAAELANSNGQKVGSLKSASSGVVQVLSKGSTEVSDYGSYDTSKIDKEIMVTVRVSFSLR